MKMRLLTLLLLVYVAHLAASEPCIQSGNSGMDDYLSDPEMLDKFLKSEAGALPWPAFILNKTAGAEIKDGRIYAYVILTVPSLDRLDAANLVLKSAVLFGLALARQAHLDRACVTIKTAAGGIARVFVPPEVAQQAALDVADSLCVKFEARCALLKKCNWEDLDKLADATAQTTPPSNPDQADGGPGAHLTRLLLSDGRTLACNLFTETDGVFAVNDASGRLVRLRKKDVLKVLPAEFKKY